MGNGASHEHTVVRVQEWQGDQIVEDIIAVEPKVHHSHRHRKEWKEAQDYLGNGSSSPTTNGHRATIADEHFEPINVRDSKIDCRLSCSSS